MTGIVHSATRASMLKKRRHQTVPSLSRTRLFSKTKKHITMNISFDRFQLEKNLLCPDLATRAHGEV